MAGHIHRGVGVGDGGGPAGAVHHVIDPAGPGGAEEDREQIPEPAGAVRSRSCLYTSPYGRARDDVGDAGDRGALTQVWVGSLR